VLFPVFRNRIVACNNRNYIVRIVVRKVYEVLSSMDGWTKLFEFFP